MPRLIKFTRLNDGSHYCEPCGEFVPKWVVLRGMGHCQLCGEHHSSRIDCQTVAALKKADSTIYGVQP